MWKPFQIAALTALVTLPAAGMTPVEIKREYGGAVVTITTHSAAGDAVWLGSGFIIDTSGVIVTCYHVINGAYHAAVKMLNGASFQDISVLGGDSIKDVAVIKVKGHGLPTVKQGNSDDIEVGEQVVAIGNPKGLENTVSNGLLSGIREMEGHNVLQISAPISPGSSGGPVFNSSGRVIGVAAATLRDGQNLNFCVPIEYARPFLQKSNPPSLEDFSGGAKPGEAGNAPDSLVVPMWADTSVEIEAVVFPPADAVLPLCYQIAWGDGDTLDWTEPLLSMIDISRYHTYRAPGGYLVSVRARDSLGRTSAWGRPHGVWVMPEPILKGVFPTSDPIVASPSLDLHGNIYVGDEGGSFYSINPVNGDQRWVSRAKDAIYGAAAIARDRVYFGSLDSNLYCLDTTGKQLWSVSLGDEVYGTPALGADGTIYVGTDKGTLAAVAPNGKRKWNYKTGDDIAGSPTVGPKGHVYITSDSVYCLDARGRRRWAFGAPEGDYFFASAVVDENDIVYVGNNDGYLYCLGPDGRQQWRSPVPEGDEVRPEVVVGTDGALYFGTDGDYLCRKSPQGTPTVFYEANDIIVGTAATSDKGTIFSLPDDGTLVAKAANGRLLWTREVASGGKEVYYSSSPTIGPDGVVYVGSWDGGLYAFRTDGPAANTPWAQYRHDPQHTGRQGRPSK